jgi:hypothetical protein
MSGSKRWSPGLALTDQAIKRQYFSRTFLAERAVCLMGDVQYTKSTIVYPISMANPNNTVMEAAKIKAALVLTRKSVTR